MKATRQFSNEDLNGKGVEKNPQSSPASPVVLRRGKAADDGVLDEVLRDPEIKKVFERLVFAVSENSGLIDFKEYKPEKELLEGDKKDVVELLKVRVKERLLEMVAFQKKDDTHPVDVKIDGDQDFISVQFLPNTNGKKFKLPIDKEFKLIQGEGGLILTMVDKPKDLEEYAKRKLGVKMVESLLDPLDCEILDDAVRTSANMIYSEPGIKSWLAMHDTDPVTNNVLQNKELQPDFMARAIIESLILGFKTDYPHMYAEYERQRLAKNKEEEARDVDQKLNVESGRDAASTEREAVRTLEANNNGGFFRSLVIGSVVVLGGMGLFAAARGGGGGHEI